MWNETAADTLREWALIADTIASLRCNHYQRQRRINTLIDIVENYSHANRPVWHETLLSLLKLTNSQAKYHLAYTHLEVCSILILFQDICHHVASNYDKWWLLWVQEPLHEDKPASPKQNRPNPFLEFFEEEDDDDTKS